MKETLKNINWKSNLIWAAVTAVISFIYYIVIDVANYKHSTTNDEW
jgi:hypothetical protein